MSDVEQPSQENARPDSPGDDVVQAMQHWRRQYAAGGLFEDPVEARQATFKLLSRLQNQEVIDEFVGRKVDEQGSTAAKVLLAMKKMPRVRKAFAVTKDLQVVNGYFGEILQLLDEDMK